MRPEADPAHRGGPELNPAAEAAPGLLRRLGRLVVAVLDETYLLAARCSLVLWAACCSGAAYNVLQNHALRPPGPASPPAALLGAAATLVIFAIFVAVGLWLGRQWEGPRAARAVEVRRAAALFLPLAPWCALAGAGAALVLDLLGAPRLLVPRSVAATGTLSILLYGAILAVRLHRAPSERPAAGDGRADDGGLPGRLRALRAGAAPHARQSARLLPGALAGAPAALRLEEPPGTRSTES